MPAKNDTTNDSLITKPSSSIYRDGWDKIFLKTPKEWADICGQDIQNSALFDGQRQITKKQFLTLNQQ